MVQMTPKAEIHQKRLCCQFGGTIKEFCTLNLNLETKRLIQTCMFNNSTQTVMQFKESLPELANCKSVVLQHNNTKPHTSSVTHQILLELGWDVLSHPPHNFELASSDYRLFFSMQNSLNGKNFNDADNVKSHLIQFLGGKHKKFYEHGNMTLPERWQTVIDKTVQYLIK